MAHVQACKFCPAGFTLKFFDPQVLVSRKRKKRNMAPRQKTKSPQLPSNMNLCNTGLKMFYKEENPFNMFARFQELDGLIGKKSFFLSYQQRTCFSIWFKFTEETKSRGSQVKTSKSLNAFSFCETILQCFVTQFSALVLCLVFNNL